MCKENIIEIKMCVVRWRTTNKFDIIGLLPIKLEVAAPTQSCAAVCKQFQLYNPQWIISIKVKSAGTQKCFWNLLITKLFWKEIFTPFGNLAGLVIKDCRILFGPSTSAVGKQAGGGDWHKTLTFKSDCIPSP